ncbi:hypothetical protein [Parabacteroides merdae]|uniref:hypothetical protein n=1 Tax=Parabacteroides merdae TaxID=46503 RepID=UPI00232C3C8B|nr:hypothetical protein [Parabacteroides merdae]MDB8928862.1 hypothetical protein [Parabacteroides merdae]
MTIYEILSFNKELLRRLSESGIRVEDYRYVDLFHDFTKMVEDGNKTTYAVAIKYPYRKRTHVVEDGNKTTYAVAVLSEKYAISERKVYDVLRHLRTDCKGRSV